MKFFRKIERSLLNKLLHKNVSVERYDKPTNIYCNIYKKRCLEAFEFLRSMLRETESGLEDNVNLFILNVEAYHRGEIYIANGAKAEKQIYYSAFDSIFCKELWSVICPLNKVRQISNSVFLKIHSDDVIEEFVKK